MVTSFQVKEKHCIYLGLVCAISVFAEDLWYNFKTFLLDGSVAGNVLTLEPVSDQREIDPCDVFDEGTVSDHSPGEECTLLCTILCTNGQSYIRSNIQS